MVNMDPKFSDSPLGKPPPRARERVGWLNTPYMIDCDAEFLIGYKNSEALTSIDFLLFSSNSYPLFARPRRPTTAALCRSTQDSQSGRCGKYCYC